MTRRQLIGFDLNGVDDRLAVAESDGPAECVDLGVRGSLVHLQAQQRWVAGRQNEAAPHGRGPAWGEIGSAEHRVELLALLERLRTAEASKREADAFASALPDLTRGSGLAVFAAPDVPDWGEAFRDRYLRLLTHAGGPRPLLLWRPVAALLGRLADCPAGLGNGDAVAVVSLMADGAHVALLTLVQEEGVSPLVPVRRRAGVTVSMSFRGGRLIEDARRRLGEMVGLPEDDIRASAWSPWRFAIGAKAAPELLRLAHNRGWKALPNLDHRPPVPDGRDLPEEALRLLGEAALLMVEGPFAGNAEWRDVVLDTLGQRIALPAQIECLAASTVALGCLEAARRDRRRQAIYFDFLPQLQINAQVEGRPQFVDLIASGKRCQGGQVFRAPAPDRYAVNRGASQFAFWLFKEDFEHGRKAEVPLPETADRRYALTVEVSQTPGQGFAEVTISSPEFDALRRRPICLNWAEMQKTSETREQILEKIGKLSGGLSWPETAVLQGHPMHWSESYRRDSLLALLVAYRREPLVQSGAIHEPTWELLKQLRQRFSASVDSRRALRSDGALPDPVGDLAALPGAGRELDRTLAKLERDLAALQRAFDFLIEPKMLGDVVGFASWCFWRCPSGVADLLLDTYSGQTRHRVNHQLLREGVARIAGSRDRLERYFAAVERRFATVNALAAAEFAGLARALGTAPEAAVVLGGQLADRLLEEACKELEAENRRPKEVAYKRRFKSALLMLTALLRHRQRRGDFVDPEAPGGQQLLSLLEETRQRNLQFAKEHRAPQRRWFPAAERMERNVEILAKLLKFVRLQGSDPNLIEQIQAMQDD